MIAFFEALKQNPLLQYAMITGLASSFASGIVGSFVVIKRIAFISGGIAHSILGGIGISVWLSNYFNIPWITPIGGALTSAIIAAVLLGWIHLKFRQREDAIIAALWSFGMAIGIIFLSITPGANFEISNYLIGNILWVSQKDLITIFILDILVFVVILFTYNRLLVICFDEKQARLQNIAVEVCYFTLLVLIAMTIVLLIQIVGVILVITMLIIPATIANHYTMHLPKMMLYAIGLTMLFFIVGIVASFYLNLPTGATIALLAGIAYLVLILYRNNFSRQKIIK